MCLLVLIIVVFFFFKQKTAYEMRISDWSSDVCSSDLASLPERSGELSGGAGRPAKPLRGRAGAGRKPPRTARQPRLALCGAGRRPQSLNRAACSARSRAFSTLPISLRGSHGTVSTRRGCLQRETASAAGMAGGCQSVYILAVAVSLTKKTNEEKY